MTKERLLKKLNEINPQEFSREKTKNQNTRYLGNKLTNILNK